MHGIVLYPKCSSISAKFLALQLEFEAENPFALGKLDYRGYDVVINYGCNRPIFANRLINNPKAVAACINKHLTFRMLGEVGDIPIPRFTTLKSDAKAYETAVVRAEVDGNSNAGLSFVDPDVEPLPDAPLYTEYFHHTHEFRIMVLNGIIISAYEKKEVDGQWQFQPSRVRYLEEAKRQCQRATIALGIDFVGFDVVVNRAKEFRILEANSGPIMTDEAINAFLLWKKKGFR